MPQCIGTTKKGERCKKIAKIDLCHLHINTSSSSSIPSDAPPRYEDLYPDKSNTQENLQKEPIKEIFNLESISNPDNSGDLDLIPKLGCMNISHIKTKEGKLSRRHDIIEGILSGRYVYIGRRSTGNGEWNGILNDISQKKPDLFMWKNPYTTKHNTIEESLRKYKQLLMNDNDLKNRIPELFGKTLLCWCVKKGYEPCHGRILIEEATNQIKLLYQSK